MPVDISELSEEQLKQHQQNISTANQTFLGELKKLARVLENNLNEINGLLMRIDRSDPQFSQADLTASGLTCSPEEYADFVSVLQHLQLEAMGQASIAPEDIAGKTIRFR